jgi:hypothetical protein
MTKNQLLGVLGGLAAIVSCDSGSAGPATAGLDANDCPLGTFRPVGFADCVFPSTDVNNQPIGVSDNRCAFGQPAIPPQCVSDTGQRDYLSTSTKCAPGYRFSPGACDRNGFGTGTAGAFGAGTAGVTGAAGAFFPVDTGTAGATGAAGFFTGEAGSPGTDGTTDSDAATTGAAGTGIFPADAATTGAAGAV